MTVGPNTEESPKGQWVSDIVRVPDGTPIRYALFKKRESFRKLLIFLNGRGDWIEKYHHLPTTLALDSEWACLTLDHRGQGGSGGRRSHIDSYSTYCNDIAYILNLVQQDAEIYLMGHSMGGLISLHSCHLKTLAPKKLVLISPLLRLQIHPYVLKISTPLLKLVTKTPLKYNHIHRSERLDSFHDNPYTHNPTHFKELRSGRFKITQPTIGWISSTIEATEKCFEPTFITNFSCPILMFTGGKEKVVCSKGFKFWSSLMSRQKAVPFSLQHISEAKHEILNETPKILTPVAMTIKDWLEID